MSILFRCDGSVEIGMGHVVRCLALADHLKENHKCNIQFAMRQSELGVNKVKESYQVLQSNEKDFNYKEWIVDCVVETKANIFIMDMRDGLTREELRYIKKETGIKVITIDDPEEKRLEADMAFYPPVPQLEKLNWDGFGGELFVGWEYVIVRKDFLKQYPKPNNEIPNILVIMGGTDEKNMTEFVINSLNQVNEKFKAVIIVGEGYPYLQQLEKQLEEIQFESVLYKNPKNIAEIMSQTDFAIISFGQTAYELAALKVQAIYLCLTCDHFESSKLFLKNSIGVSIGVFPNIKNGDLSKTIGFQLSKKQVYKEIPISRNLLKIINNGSNYDKKV